MNFEVIANHCAATPKALEEMFNIVKADDSDLDSNKVMAWVAVLASRGIGNDGVSYLSVELLKQECGLSHMRLSSGRRFYINLLHRSVCEHMSRSIEEFEDMLSIVSNYNDN